MNVLIGCECSGIVRDAFRALGHNAWSCDLKECERGPEFHIVGDVLELFTRCYAKRFRSWDILIAHPDCTYLTVSNNGPMANGCSKYTAIQAREYREQAVNFFMAMVNAPVARIAVENPIGIMSTRYRKADQIIQPYDFGDDASKKTGLWLKNIPPLIPTKRIAGRMVNGVERWENQTDSGQNRLSPHKNRKADRARTYPGIARAMAEQWGDPGKFSEFLYAI